MVDLCAGLGARGHEMYLAAPADSPVLGRLRKAGRQLDANRVLPIRIRNSTDIFSAQKIARFAAANQIDLIHAHLARDYIPAAVAARLAPGVKLALTRHVMFPLKKATALALRNTDAVIAVSEPLAAQMRKSFAAEKICVIRNGIDPKVFSATERPAAAAQFRKEYNIPGQAPLIGCVGELKPLKGQQDFLAAAAIVAQKFSDATFVIAGRDNSRDAKFQQTLKQEAARLGLADKVTWINWLEGVAPLLAALDVFVSPSHSESFGLATLEAMAAECAIVATETDGARELLATGCARLTLVKDPQALAAAMIELLENEPLKKELAANARARAAAAFSLERMVAETEDLFQRLLTYSQGRRFRK